ncbi:hypothetical protein MTQ01_20690 [Streptomyces sp. XM4193]|uniref:hypothetical protein n=1 Tax=Streptomyces sp. XM4193 TaxID=2929782 RepID=UPI001FFB151D|nr:hypothetical protein [Streptomyces sp. XM4193]MCK1798400.1 hypothetical protein [Streptomyces sp. XM4193]
MIAAGAAPDATEAAHLLASALADAGICLPGLRLDPHVWDTPDEGPGRLVALGAVHPRTAVELATVIRRGAAS